MNDDITTTRPQMRSNPMTFRLYQYEMAIRPSLAIKSLLASVKRTGFWFALHAVDIIVSKRSNANLASR